jgi:hypothetical protein
MKKVIFIFYFLSICACFANAKPIVDTIGLDLPCDSSLYKKFVDNKGQGEMSFMGLRNLRPVLNGVLYRSGGNNNFAPFNSRANDNPLSFQTLVNLRENGFSKAYYLYAKNFDFHYSKEMLEGLNSIGIAYSSMVPKNDSIAYILLNEVYESIKNPNQGAILMHCWNGWHMSGLISALSLIQFCNYSPADAWEYWRKCTDGNDKGYTKIKDRIFNFIPSTELAISTEEQAKICPCKFESH